MLIETYSQTEEAIIRALATHRFLSIQQLERLGVAKRSYLYEVFRELPKTVIQDKRGQGADHDKKRSRSAQRPPLVIELRFGTWPGEGKLPYIYTLAPYGAEVANELLGEDTFIVSKRIRLFKKEYFHRRMCVDFQIALSLWAAGAGAHVDRYISYYEPRTKEGRGLAPQTRVRLQHGYLDPDAIFSVVDRSGTPRHFSFELTRERRTKYVEDKVVAYMRAIQELALERTFEWEKRARIVWVFEDEEGFALVRKRMESYALFNEPAMHRAFFAKTAAELSGSFLEGWRTFSNQRVALFANA